jgi:hypothetical protein
MARIHPGEAPASFVIQVRVFLACTVSLRFLKYYPQIFQKMYFVPQWSDISYNFAFAGLGGLSS